MRHWFEMAQLHSRAICLSDGAGGAKDAVEELLLHVVANFCLLLVDCSGRWERSIDAGCWAAQWCTGPVFTSASTDRSHLPTLHQLIGLLANIALVVVPSSASTAPRQSSVVLGPYHMQRYALGSLSLTGLWACSPFPFCSDPLVRFGPPYPDGAYPFARRGLTRSVQIQCRHTAKSATDLHFATLQPQ